MKLKELTPFIRFGTNVALEDKNGCGYWTETYEKDCTVPEKYIDWFVGSITSEECAMWGTSRSWLIIEILESSVECGRGGEC